MSLFILLINQDVSFQILLLNFIFNADLVLILLNHISCAYKQNNTNNTMYVYCIVAKWNRIKRSLCNILLDEYNHILFPNNILYGLLKILPGVILHCNIILESNACFISFSYIDSTIKNSKFQMQRTYEKIILNSILVG